MLCSLSRSPSAPERSTRSEPARSTSVAPTVVGPCGGSSSAARARRGAARRLGVHARAARRGSRSRPRQRAAAPRRRRACASRRRPRRGPTWCCASLTLSGASFSPHLGFSASRCELVAVQLEHRRVHLALAQPLALAQHGEDPLAARGDAMARSGGGSSPAPPAAAPPRRRRAPRRASCTSCPRSARTRTRTRCAATHESTSCRTSPHTSVCALPGPSPPPSAKTRSTSKCLSSPGLPSSPAGSLTVMVVAPCAAAGRAAAPRRPRAAAAARRRAPCP